MKKTYIECLRMIAIILVIYNHTRELGFNLYQYTSNCGSYYLSVIMIPICKTAVPVFLMISGVTLLGKTESYRELFVRRILKYAGIILFWGTLQYFRYVRTGKIILSVGEWWKNIYSTPILETYWYLYMYLGFLLILPLLRKIASGMSEKDYCYLFALNCVCSILMVIGYCSGCFINYNVFNLPSIMVYPLLGFGIDKGNYIFPHKNFKENNILKYGLMILFSLCFIIPISLHQLRITDSYAEFTDLVQCLTPIITVGIFGFVKEIDNRYFHSAKLQKIMILGGGYGIWHIFDGRYHT